MANNNELSRINFICENEEEKRRIQDKMKKVRNLGFKSQIVLPKIFDKGLDDFLKKNHDIKI